MSALILHIRLHDGRYHGEGDWPPSPARLFQALVAGAGLGSQIKEDEITALKWMEEQDPPIIGAPHARRADQRVLLYMPNNDSDRIEGDPARIAAIRTDTKTFQPYFFDPNIEFLYIWKVEETDQKKAETVLSLAERLYQFGRGIDLAWAWGEILNDQQLEELITKYDGHIFYPSGGKSEIMLRSPRSGSLESLRERYQAYRQRFRYTKQDRSVKVLFRKPPPPLFQVVAYNSPPSRQLYDLQEPASSEAFAPWPLERVYSLVVLIRDGAVKKLKQALHSRQEEIERVLVGRKPDGSNACPPEQRVRLIPLPSIGHFHADRQIRRVLVEVPPKCLLCADDVYWAFSGLDVVNRETGEVQATLIRSDDQDFLRHFGISDNQCYCLWRTVTPAALPVQRRRIEPTRMRQEAKAGEERRKELEQAAAAVIQALRHVGIRTRVDTIRVQREPFESNGERVEPFAAGSRFSKHELWHVEIRFAEGISGPLVIGNGRFLGLGLMAPVRSERWS
jgi:CRISPR-associated protein Csb2